MLRWCCDGGTRSVSPPPPSGLRRVGLCTALDNSKEPSLVLSDASSKVMPAPSSRTPPIPAAIAWLSVNNFRSLMLPWPSLVTLLLLNGAQWYCKDGDTDDFQRKGKIKSVQKGSCPHRKDRVHLSLHSLPFTSTRYALFFRGFFHNSKHDTNPHNHGPCQTSKTALLFCLVEFYES